MNGFLGSLKKPKYNLSTTLAYVKPLVYSIFNCRNLNNILGCDFCCLYSWYFHENKDIKCVAVYTLDCINKISQTKTNNK